LEINQGSYYSNQVRFTINVEAMKEVTWEQNAQSLVLLVAFPIQPSFLSSLPTILYRRTLVVVNLWLPSIVASALGLFPQAFIEIR